MTVEQCERFDTNTLIICVLQLHKVRNQKRRTEGKVEWRENREERGGIRIVRKVVRQGSERKTQKLQRACTWVPVNKKKKNYVMTKKKQKQSQKKIYNVMHNNNTMCPAPLTVKYHKLCPNCTV